LPMSDDPVRTRLKTDQGWLDFQDYFVRLRCEPKVEAIVFDGAASARPQQQLMAALQKTTELRAVVICPSNPLISIDPILAVPGLRTALAAVKAPVVGVSPIVRRQALKGPTARMLTQMSIEPTAQTVLRRYDDFLD